VIGLFIIVGANRKEALQELIVDALCCSRFQICVCMYVCMYVYVHICMKSSNDYSCPCRIKCMPNETALNNSSDHGDVLLGFGAV
jgi:hypothetical protein